MTRHHAQLILDKHSIEWILDDDERSRLLQDQHPGLFDAYEALRAYAQEPLPVRVQNLRNACLSAADVLAWLETELNTEPMKVEAKAALGIIQSALYEH